jgi:hypothetical protein
MKMNAPSTKAYADLLLSPIGTQGGDHHHDGGPTYLDPQVRFASMAYHAEKIETLLRDALDHIEAWASTINVVCTKGSPILNVVIDMRTRTEAIRKEIG